MKRSILGITLALLVLSLLFAGTVLPAVSVLGGADNMGGRNEIAMAASAGQTLTASSDLNAGDIGSLNIGWDVPPLDGPVWEIPFAVQIYP